MIVLGFFGGFGEFIASRVVLHVIAVIVSAFWGSSRVRKWRRDTLKGTRADLFEFARAAVQETWDTYVEEIKLAADYGGKLTKAQRRDARQRALVALGRIVHGKAGDMLGSLGAAEREVLIEDAVSSMKTN